MAKVLQNFLIGVGLDTERYDQGAKRVESSLGRMRTNVGFTGAAITGAFAAAGGAAIAAGKRVDDFNLATENLKTSRDFVYSYGRALASLGGDADEAVVAINAAENALAQFGLKGSFGPFEEAAFAGVREELNALMQAQDGGELLRGLAGVMPNLNKDQQRLIQDAFSLSPAVMRSLRGGVDQLDAQIARAGELLGDGFQGATEAARDFNRATAEMGTRLQGISDTLAQNILPSFTGVVDSLGGFIDRNRDLIDRSTKEHPQAASLVGTSAMALGAGATLSTLGLRGIGGLAMRGGVAGMAIGSGLIAADMGPDDIESLTGYRPSDYIFDNTPFDAARDAYNKVAEKYGFERSEKGSGVISYLEGSYGRVDTQLSDMEAYLLEYGRTGGASKPRGVIEEVAPYDPNAPFGMHMPLGVDNYGDYLPMNVDNYHDGYRPDPIVESPTSGFITPYEGIYGGGEVSVSEAANASPDVITIRDQRQRADEPVTPPRINVENHLEVQMEMDGRAVDTRVVEVIERRERDTIDDIYSSVDR